LFLLFLRFRLFKRRSRWTPRSTCDQFVHSKVAPTRTVAAWLSGFYSGKRDNRVIDLQNFEANLSKLENFCYEEKNYKLLVMQAIEKVIGRGK
jgi:acid stress chaperone HdeB